MQKSLETNAGQPVGESLTKLNLEAVLHQFINAGQPLLLAIQLKNFQPRLLTSVDDKQYLVLFSSLEQVHLEDMSTSLLAMPAKTMLQQATKEPCDGIMLNPWGKRLTVPKQLVRHVYYQYLVLQYTEDNWWQSPLWADDYEALMWDNAEPYDELWLEALIAEQNRTVVNVAWWAKEQPKRYKQPPLFVKIWLVFYGAFWLQTIFAAGLNTIFNKEMDEASILQSIILSIGCYFIFKYLPQFVDWWDAREQKKAEALAQAQWEAAAPQRDLELKLQQEAELKALEQKLKQEAAEQAALQILQAELTK